MDFPKESIELAREITAKYKKRTRSKWGLASHIYDKKFFHIGYGFSEPLKEGRFGSYLHEANKEVECYSMAGIIYLIAREAGLNPKIYDAQGMRDIDEGEDKSEVGKSNHAFVTVDGTKGKRFLVDPHMGQFGEATFDPNENKMRIYNRGDRKITYRDWNMIRELSQDQYLEELEQNRTAEGGKNILAATQRVNSMGGFQVYVTYIPDTSELKTSSEFTHALIGSDDYNRKQIFELKTPVKKDGSFSLEEGVFSQFNASAVGWTEHINPQVPVSFSLPEAQPIYDIWEKFIRSKGKKSSLFRMGPYRTEHLLLENGLWCDFSVEKGSDLEKIIYKHKHNWERSQEWAHKRADDFLKRAIKDDITYRCLLREAHRVKASDTAHSQENPDGFIYSKEEHVDFLRQVYEESSQDIRNFVEEFVRDLGVQTKLIPGSNFHSQRKLNKVQAKRVKSSEGFEALRSARTFQSDIIFDGVADRLLFYKTLDVDSPIKELEKGLTKVDMQRAAQEKVFSAMINSWLRREFLFVRQYKKGLQKALAIS